jgi:hypothetical protein
MDNLKLSQAAAGIVAQPRMPCEAVLWHVRHRRTVSLAQNPQKEGPAFVNRLEANLQSKTAASLLLGHAPAQIDIVEVDPVLF